MKKLNKWIKYKYQPWLWAIVHSDFRQCEIQITLPIRFKELSIDLSYGHLEIQILIRFQKPSIKLMIPQWIVNKYPEMRSASIAEHEKYLELDPIPF
jgi:hypothetical protein